MSRYLNLDSYHGTQSIPPQRIFVRLDLNLEGPARHYSCAGNSGRFSGAKLLKAGFRFSAFGFRQP
jgi:hypothetical protein